MRVIPPDSSCSPGRLVVTTAKARPRRLIPRWGWSLLAVLGLVALAFWARSASPERGWAAIEASLGAGRWPEAEGRLEAWVRRDGRDGAAWLKLGAVRSIQGRGDAALAAFEKVDESD